MTVRQLFFAADDLHYDDIVTIIDATKELYEGTFCDVIATVYAEYEVNTFSQEEMYIEVL